MEQRATVRWHRGRRVRPVHRRALLRARSSPRRRDVIKIESVREIPCASWRRWRRRDPSLSLPDRGKHSLPLDLRHPSAARVVERLLARADVALMNFRPGWPPSSASTGRACAALSATGRRQRQRFGRRGPAARLAGWISWCRRAAVSSRRAAASPTGADRRRESGRRLHVRDDARVRIASALLRRASTGAAARWTHRSSWPRS